tara:strand:+ start:334 stop:552 length:219 start_codon:yes stop_codon:yes gene_type:complete
MEDEKYTALIVTEKELDLVYTWLEAAADDLIFDLQNGLSPAAALIINQEHDLLIALLSKIEKDKKRREQDEA